MILCKSFHLLKHQHKPIYQHVTSHSLSHCMLYRYQKTTYPIPNKTKGDGYNPSPFSLISLLLLPILAVSQQHLPEGGTITTFAPCSPPIADRCLLSPLPLHQPRLSTGYSTSIAIIIAHYLPNLLILKSCLCSEDKTRNT